MNGRYELVWTGDKIKFGHRIVVEKKLGRALNSDEVIHHIDGDPRNNSEDNLTVMARGEHARLHMIGKKKSKEAIEKLRKWMTGRKHSAEWCKNTGLSKKGTKLSDEHKEKVRKTMQERRTKAKLNPKDVRDIRKMLADGIMNRDIAKVYGLTRQAIDYIEKRKTWGWLK